MHITERERECVVAIANFKSQFPPRLNQIAAKLKIKSPTALSLLKRLQAKGLVQEQRGSVLLTKSGKTAYAEIMLAHRCLEIIFAKAGIPADCACREATKIDYLVDPAYAKKLWKYLGKPKMCPHGKPVVVNA
ncbi:MAG: metal-dependent transcriptional regulator [Candidatus Micrarchaeia archaeon]